MTLNPLSPGTYETSPALAALRKASSVSEQVGTVRYPSSSLSLLIVSGSAASALLRAIIMGLLSILMLAAKR
ncbi:MAG: hypothetical protein A4E30_00861 [Methanomassiliicoccales archaeon PtaB.Bin215]|nr:MAG: hypothetical protein A4E30_00861 [Methanomassiliicoccales archaeon PtaB.Bin215]